MINALITVSIYFLLVVFAGIGATGILYLICKKTGYKKGFIQFLKEF